MNYVMLTDYYHFFFNATYIEVPVALREPLAVLKKILIQLIILDINNFVGISHIYMAICGLSLHLGSSTWHS